MEINVDDYDIDRLREDLINLIGPATTIIEYAQYDLVNVEICDEKNLILLALSFNFNLDDYRKYVR